MIYMCSCTYDFLRILSVCIYLHIPLLCACRMCIMQHFDNFCWDTEKPETAWITRFIEQQVYLIVIAVYSFPNLLVFISVMSIWKLMRSK